MSNTDTVHNIVLGTKADGSIVVLERIFSHSDGFQGAVGAVVRPVTDADVKEAMSEKVEYLRELVNDIDAHGEQRRQITRMPKDEYLEYRFETYRDISRESIAKALSVEVPERYTLEAVGRIFSRYSGPSELDGIQLIDTEEVRAAVEQIEQMEARA